MCDCHVSVYAVVPCPATAAISVTLLAQLVHDSVSVIQNYGIPFVCVGSSKALIAKSYDAVELFKGQQLPIK